MMRIHIRWKSEVNYENRLNIFIMR